MSVNVCTCHFCVDPREHGHSIQHGLDLYNGFYIQRVKGSFVPRPVDTGEVSTTTVMLLELGRHPTVMFQGHRDCAAVRLLFESYGKKWREFTNSELEFRRSHQAALDAVKKIAGHLPLDQQLSLLEQLCVLQSVNNLFTFSDIRAQIGTQDCHAVYAYYSLTPQLAPGETLKPEAAETIELMIFDAVRKSFVRSSQPGSNRGIRLSDLIDTKTFLPKEKDDRYRIKGGIDLEEVAHCQLQTLPSPDSPAFGLKQKVIA